MNPAGINKLATPTAPADDTEETGGNVIQRMITRAKSNKSLRSLTSSLQNRHRDSEDGSSQTKEATYHRVIIDGDDGDKDFQKAAPLIGTIILIRDRYKEIDQGQEEEIEDIDVDETEVEMTDGIYSFTGMKTSVVSWKQYVQDMGKVLEAIESGPALSAARQRLNVLHEKFELYSLLNTDLEEQCDKVRGGGGVYAKCAKVDNNVRLTTSMNASTLVRNIVDISDKFSHEFVAQNEEGQPITLEELMANSGVINWENLTVEGLGLHPPLQRKRFHHFDVFNEKLNPGGKPMVEILKVFLRKETLNHGKFFGMICKGEMDRRESAKQINATEMKIPIFGKNKDEWAVMARWIKENQLHHHSRNCWSIQIPRFENYRKTAADGFDCETQADQLRNIFYPLFMATLHPRHPEHADIAQLLQRVGSFNVTSDETQRTTALHVEPMPPETIPWTKNTHDFYFFYYIWANICTLNALRKKRGMNTFKFCPTAGEIAPHFDQLISSYLMADSIYHGWRLSKSWIMQYLYMFHRIGIAMSPLSNNSLYVPYFENPFPIFFKRGLNVSLSTDNPLHFHHHPEPLTEEYATAMKIFQLTATDMVEIARNSVVNSGFSHELKSEWLGINYAHFADGNDVTKSNLSDFRLQFRYETLFHEQNVLNLMLSQSMKENPIVIGKLKARRQHVAVDTMQLFRNMRRINYTDRRIVYPRIDIFGGFQHQVRSHDEAAEPIQRVLKLRSKYVRNFTQDVSVEAVFQQGDDRPRFNESIWEYGHYYGVYILSRVGTPSPWPSYIPPISDFVEDIEYVKNIAVSNADVVSLARHRLHLLEHKFMLHSAMNISKEAGLMKEKEWNNRDFYTAHKVDNNIHTDSGMNARALLEFFVEKATNNGHDVVMERKSSPVTLRQLLDEMGVNVSRLACDELQHLISSETDTRLRDLFLATDNFMGGRYFAELTKRTIDQFKLDEYTFAENRLEVTGSSPDEWSKLAEWFDRYGMASSQNRWMIRFPRSYRRLKQGGAIKNFGQLIDNWFLPLWEASLHPAQNAKFHYFLSHVSGFDCVDDESKVDLPMSSVYPHEWSSSLNPAYNYYLYYLWANIVSLNEFRSSRGLSTFSFRPQCGERGSVDHLIGGFLLANGINHGLTLTKYPALEYLYFAAQIGIAMSPLSNTSSACAYLENPFPKFFYRGLNVSLSTNQPLYFHFTSEPLVEEYSIAGKIWKFQFNDQSEIARNSVLQSGFPPSWKEQALGQLYHLHSTLGNDVRKSRVSDIRVAYRFEVYHTEMNFLDDLLNNAGKVSKVPRAMFLLEREVDVYEKITGSKVEMPGDSDEDDDTIGPVDPVKKSANLKHQLADLERQLLKTKMQVQQVAGENTNMADTIKKLRQRIKSEPMRIGATIDGDGK